MDKTRMGKRVASLLLSLVMMLSLLPTAAYATMADDVETQGAIVSENGTGVSDDSNSSGNTDDLQVGGSSGSGTADDTTGAEGGADPTDSVNENDSADPQDDGDAVMPVASSVVSTSEELVAAIAAASDGDTITLGEGEFTTVGNTSPKKSLTFEGVGTNTVWTIGDLDKDVGGEGNGDYSFEGCDTITFKNMTLKVDNKNYRGFIRINHTVVENCTLEGRTAYWGYETAKFVGSTFTAPEGDYALWDYSTKDMSFDGCTFNISGKGVHVYVEAANADKDVTRTVAVNNCTVNSDKANKAFLNIKNSTQAYDVTLSGTNTVNGLTADGTTGSALYQVETTRVTETTGNPVTVKQANTAGELETVYEVKQPSANVAKVGDTEYATLDKAIAALSSSSYTLELLDGSVWDEATPVYWAAGSKSGYVATLADALTAAYMANAGGITIVCRPGTDVGKLTHGHVADDITIYGNNAYISSGECDLEVDTYMFSRDTGKQVTTGGAYLDKDITVTAYELDNLGVWGQRHTGHKVTVNLTDCDSVHGITVQRVYISGTTGVNDITLTGCDFGTKATSVYSNADGKVVIDNCSFTGAQVPVNFNHKANGTQTVTVQNSKFTNCGDNGDWKQFAAPVRFVNSGSGTMNTTVGTCTFTDTVGGNGDILLGDGREGEKSNNVSLTVENTAANVQAQQPGYYAKNGTTDESKQGTKNVAADDKLTTSVTQLMPSSETTYVAEVKGVKYKSLQAAIDKAGRNATVKLLADTRENVTIAEMMTLDLNGHTLNGGQVKAKPALTVTARVTVKDSSAAKTGTIMREDTAENFGVSSHYVIDIQGNGWLTFESGNVKNNSGTDSGKGASLVRVGDDSVDKYPGLNIKGGTFTQDNFIVIKVDSGDLFLNGGTLNSANSYAVENWHRAAIKGGTVNGTVAAWTYSGGHNSTLTISGGTVNDNVASVSYDKAEGKVAKVSITGGTVTGTLGTYTYGNGLIPIEDPAKATIAVTGGTFSKDPSKYVVENSGVTPNGDGTFGVAKAYLAKVGDTSYYTMDEAFKAQTASGKAIVLLRDYTTGSTFSSGSINRTVDLADHTWTCTGKDANSAAFEINYPDVTLTVKNGKVVSSQLVGLIPSAMGGTIKYDNSGLVFEDVVMETSARSGIETNGNNTNDTVTLRNSTLNVPNGFGIYFPSSGTLTIDNSVINAQTMGVQVCAGSLNVTGADTAITVSGDGIAKTENDGAIEDGAAISIVERTGYKGLDEIKVEGGKFTAKAGNDAVKAYKWDNTNKTESAFDNSKNVVAVSGGTFSSAVDKSLCADGFIPTKNEDGTYGVKEGQYVAEVGSQGYESLTEAVAAAEDGQTVTLLADAAEDVVISKSITLDLGGKTLTNTNAGKATISVTGGTVTVKNGNVMGGTGYYNIEVTKEGSNANLTLTDVTATAGNTGSSMIDNYGTLTITSGTYTGGLNVVKSEEGSVLNISGGTFTLEYATNGYTGVIFAYGDTTISGGEFIQNLTTTGRWNHPQVILTGVVEGYTAITKVTGGHFVNKMSGESIFRGVGKATSDNFKVSGGTFNKSISESFCADGFIPTKNADGTYGVKEGQYVAKVGSTKYETLADAIRLAAKGRTVTLLADVADCGSLTISKNITLDGGGHTISGNSSISVNMPDNAAADVTIKNVNFKDIANGNKLSAFYFSQVKGKLTITGCTFDSIEYEAIQVTPMEGAEVNVSSNVFKAKADGTQVRHIHIEMAYGSGFDCEGQNIKLTVTDNQLHGTVSGDASMGIWWVGTDSTLKVDGNYMEHPETVSITLSNGGVHYNRGDLIYPARSQADADVDDLIPAVIVADKASGESKIKAYSTLADAVAAAQNGQTITLLADVEQNTQLAIDKSITLDLNGKTIKNTVDIWGDNTNAILSIKKGAKVTITGNGTIAAKENDCYTINVVNGDLTIENGTFVGNISVVQVQKGSLTINGGAFSLLQKMTDGKGENRYLINCIDDTYADGSATVAISGGTFVGFDPNVSPEQKVDGKAPSFAAPGTGITRNADGSFTAVDGMTAQILDKDGNSVKAYRTLAEAVAAAEDGQTVRLLADVTLDAQIATGKAITIDGQSKYTIRAAKLLVSADNKAGMFYRTGSANGTLTFLNVTLDGNGVSKIFLNEGGAGETVFDGVTSTNGGGWAYGSGIHISGGGSHATIRNSTLTGSTGTMELNNANYYAANDLWVGGNVYVTVENSVIGTVFVNSAPSATATNGVVHGQLTITGESTKITYLSGEEESADKLDKFGNNGSLVKIDSGYVEKVFDKGSYAISGGTFETVVKKEWCAAGYVPADNGNGTYGVEEGKFTVMVTSRTTGSNSPVANVAGGGSDITYAQGTTVTASAISGYNFVGWFVNEYTGTPYSTDLTCEVKPTDDWTMIAVYEPISGGKFWLTVTASEFTVNGGAVQDSYLYEQFAVGASVTVNFTGSENFLYWVNASNKVVSTDKSYTFIMGSETTLKAVYGKARQNQATVVFISHSDQIISSKAYTTADTIQFPVPPIKMGCTFTGWSMTEAEIRAAMANNSGIIQVRALYTNPSIACKVTVIYPDGIGNDVVNAVVGKAINVTAKDIEGKTFSYWTDNAGNVLGYTKTLKLAPSGDMTVKAVYDEAAEAKPVITISEVSATTANESYVVTFMATRAVPDGYKVVKQGILWSRDAVCGEDGAAAYMQFDSNGKLPTGVNAYIGNSLELNGVTRLDITTKYNDRTFYGRGYMVLESDAGELLYIYTNTIASGSYDSLTK